MRSPDNAMIYHLTLRPAWHEAQSRGEYIADSLPSEGFIHCSTKTQILPVAEKFFKGGADLLVLEIDPSLLSSSLRWEPPSGGSPPPGVPQGDLFPHVYGPINLDSVVKVYDLESASDGEYRLPEFE